MSTLDPQLLSEIEDVAVELAQLGGAEIRAALGGMLRIKYKSIEDREGEFRDPVSEVDRRVEELIRERLADRFPDHDIVGEEIDHRPSLGSDFLWAVDPIDGTANFINGFPMFASSVGVLYRGRPVVGALWCSTSHALESGVYHAAHGTPLRFNGAPLDTRSNPAIRRRLGGEPRTTASGTHAWDGRKTGSAAIECAFVAAGLLDMAWFERPNLWDVAGGLALTLAAGKAAQVHGARGWSELHSFADDGDPAHWSARIAIGNVDTVNTFVRQNQAA